MSTSPSTPLPQRMDSIATPGFRASHTDRLRIIAPNLAIRLDLQLTDFSKSHNACGRLRCEPPHSTAFDRRRRMQTPSLGADHMLAHAFSSAANANDEQWLDANLEDALLQEAPDLAGSVLGQCRAANNAGYPEFARELLACAV